MSQPVTRAPLVLIVEDEVPLRESVARHLAASGFTAVEAGSVAAGLAAAWEHQPDVVLLDVLLPDGSGYDFCAELRRITSAPIIYVTALGQDAAVVRGLAAGGDDYLTKPFSPRELALRVRSVLRRSTGPVGPVPPELAVGALRVLPSARSVTLAGRRVNLTNREFDLLVFFLTNSDVVFSREDLLKRVWRWDFGDLSTVTVHIKRLRSKLGDQHRIQTVWGRGYLWSSGAEPR